MTEAKIYGAISDIIAECPAIGKKEKNKQQGFMYRGVDVVMNVFQPLLAKHRVFVVPEVLEAQREERKTAKGGNLIYTVLRVRFTFYAEDGSSVSAVVQGEGMDSADKSSNKAMSVAFKYACFQVFCIPTEEMKDPDAETPPQSAPPAHKCTRCGRDITGVRTRSGSYTAAEVYQNALRVYHTEMCWDCMKAEKEANTHAGNC